MLFPNYPYNFHVSAHDIPTAIPTHFRLTLLHTLKTVISNLGYAYPQVYEPGHFEVREKNLNNYT
jgi:hypothetical protein